MCRGNGCQIDLGLLPMLAGAVMLLGILTTYIIAVSLGHVSPLLPSISDTGIMSPEMHIFSQVLNIVAILAFVTFILRYKMIQAMLDDNDTRKLRTLTRCSLIIGCIASVGLSIVGNFQDNTSAIVHLIGACMVFFLGNVYILLDSVVTNSMSPRYNGKPVFVIRLLLGIIGMAAFIGTVVGASIANKNSIFTTKEERLHWGPDDAGFAAHVASSACEWLMGLAFVCYFFTYIKDFGKFDTELRVKMKVDHLDQEPQSSDHPGLSRSSESDGAKDEPNEQTHLLGGHS